MTRPTRMTQHVRDYLALRRAFGFQLTIAGQQLHQFALFADRVAPGKPLTVEIALRWAQTSPTKKPTSAARRLLLLRPFARYLRTIEPSTEIPPQRLLGRAQHRPTPHIYTVDEIRALLAAARGLRPRGGLRHCRWTPEGVCRSEEKEARPRDAADPRERRCRCGPPVSA